MLNLACSIISKIVFSGINGTVLIIPLILIFRVIWGQARETMELFTEKEKGPKGLPSRKSQ